MKCDRCGQNTIQDALGREITILTPFLWLKPLRWIGEDGSTREESAYSTVTVVHPLGFEVGKGKYQIFGTSREGTPVTISGEVGKNPLIYKLAESIGELER